MAASMVSKVLVQFSRLKLTQMPIQVRTISSHKPLFLKTSPTLCGITIRKRKKVDPAIFFQREAKRKRRIEKAIRKLDRENRKLKPIYEIEGDRKLIKEASIRRRPPPVLTFEESEKRALLQKEWTRYKLKEHSTEVACMRKAIHSQEKALSELRKESEDLYQQAIEVDETLIPFEVTGPTLTAPIDNFDPTDGEYIDTTKKFDDVIMLSLSKLTEKRRKPS